MLKSARKVVGMRQDDAACRLFIGERTLKNYEKRGQAPPDVVQRMTEVYGQDLTQRYCSEVCPIGRKRKAAH